MVNTTVFINSNGNYPQSLGSMIDSTATDADGNYSFPNLPMGDSYFVSASNNNCQRDGISVSDATKIISHLLFQNSFSDPFEYIVADTNNDGTISVSDVLFIQFLLLGIINEFPNQDSYLITRSDLQFSEANPLTTSWKQTAFLFEVKSLSGPALVPDFIAYKSGDSNFTSTGCNE